MIQKQSRYLKIPARFRKEKKLNNFEGVLRSVWGCEV